MNANPYIVPVTDDTLAPRYRSGELVMVDPAVTPAPDDDVVVTLHDGRQVICTMDAIPAGDKAAIHCVIGRGSRNALA